MLYIVFLDPCSTHALIITVYLISFFGRRAVVNVLTLLLRKSRVYDTILDMCADRSRAIIPLEWRDI